MMNKFLEIIEKSGTKHYVDLYYARVLSIEGNKIVVDLGSSGIFTCNDVVNIDKIKAKFAEQKRLWTL